MQNVRLSELSEAICSELENYSQVLTEELKQEIKDEAKRCRKEIRDASPKRTGHYKRGWRTKITHENLNDIRIKIYNSSDYQLTHLLENGYVCRNGRRIAGRPHIRPAEENLKQRFMGRVRSIVRGG